MCCTWRWGNLVIVAGTCLGWFTQKHTQADTQKHIGTNVQSCPWGCDKRTVNQRTLRNGHLWQIDSDSPFPPLCCNRSVNNLHVTLLHVQYAVVVVKTSSQDALCINVAPVNPDSLYTAAKLNDFLVLHDVLSLDFFLSLVCMSKCDIWLL